MKKEIMDLVLNLKEPTLALITTDTVVKLNKKDVATKTIPNPYAEIRKVAVSLVELAPRYEKAVNDQREAEGKEQDFEAQERKWGTNLGNGVVENNGKFYISAIFKESRLIEYFDGVDSIEKKEFEQFMPVKKPGNNQGVEQAVKFQSYSLENIKGVEIL